MNDTPNSEQLIERIRVFFGVVPTHHASDELDSPYISSENIDDFDVAIAAVGTEPADPAKIAATWLTTPNPSFGGLCPQNFIDGNDDQRAFLAAFLSSIEDGAFS